ncbi:hypothetical protein Goari_020722 [Gossypium aridum]|uniref:RNase H type-1 domain-containing protein n=1 Tax=Gossypium aridum TaxID=34290 RepID=A0A7J8YNJ7_GOSAI|nr:hypothetical protein [Gossypium aridum]
MLDVLDVHWKRRIVIIYFLDALQQKKFGDSYCYHGCLIILKILFGIGFHGFLVESSTRTSIYFDAAFDKQNARSASGLLVRGEGGEILVSKSVIHSNIGTPFAAEAHAGLQALELGRSMGLTDLQIKGDSKTLSKSVKVQNKTDQSLEQSSEIFKSLKLLLIASGFVTFQELQIFLPIRLP